jgi:hypothetical protein
MYTTMTGDTGHRPLSYHASGHQSKNSSNASTKNGDFTL